jgi:large subunit ribosomal protein L17
MRHQSKSRRFGRGTAHRKSTFCNLVTSLFLRERILTTVEKAKELRRVAEKLITLGKRGDLAARRLAARKLKAESHLVGNRMVWEETALKKLFLEIAPRYKSRPGGYTRIIRTGPRLGDNASMAFIELLSDEQQKSGVEGKKGAKKSPKASAKGSTVKKAAEKKAPAKKAASAKAHPPKHAKQKEEGGEES